MKNGQLIKEALVKGFIGFCVAFILCFYFFFIPHPIGFSLTLSSGVGTGLFLAHIVNGKYLK